MKYQLNNKTLTSGLVGTWSWGKGNNGSKMIFGQNFTKEQLQEVFEKAYASGFNAWDTAEVYGMGTAETLIGEFIKDKPDVFISTKHFPGKRYKDGETRAALEASLKRLGLSKADLYFLHSPKNIESNMKEMAELYKEGLIGSIGLSNGNPEQIARRVRSLRKTARILMPYRTTTVFSRWKEKHPHLPSAKSTVFCSSATCFSSRVLCQAITTKTTTLRLSQ